MEFQCACYFVYDVFFIAKDQCYYAECCWNEFQVYLLPFILPFKCTLMISLHCFQNIDVQCPLYSLQNFFSKQTFGLFADARVYVYFEDMIKWSRLQSKVALELCHHCERQVLESKSMSLFRRQSVLFCCCFCRRSRKCASTKRLTFKIEKKVWILT